jgi:hypothetical protein
VLRVQVVGQPMVMAVEAPSRQMRQPSRFATSERLAQALERAVTHAIEGEPEEQVRDPQWPLQREVGVVGDPRAPVGGLERDPVERDDGRVLAPQRDGLARLELDDPVSERGLAAEEVRHEPELRPLADRSIIEPLRLDDPRIPLLRRGEVAQVRERLGGGRVSMLAV